ncbi:hypothetical protein DFH29DRAFT_496735 [Suillus ampliporus]|nr:hypothetical protein DFH29DRAFT_496735 [Suillus ampliporus]
MSLAKLTFIFAAAALFVTAPDLAEVVIPDSMEMLLADIYVLVTQFLKVILIRYDRCTYDAHIPLVYLDGVIVTFRWDRVVD